MTKQRSFLSLIGFGVFLILCPSLHAQENKLPDSTAHVSDQRLGHEIHNTIVADSTLPYCAHVVAVHADKGVVTLKGWVHTDEEKDKLREKAAEFIGDDNVITDIRVIQGS